MGSPTQLCSTYIQSTLSEKIQGQSLCCQLGLTAVDSTQKKSICTLHIWDLIYEETMVKHKCARSTKADSLYFMDCPVFYFSNCMVTSLYAELRLCLPKQMERSWAPRLRSPRCQKYGPWWKMERAGAQTIRTRCLLAGKASQSKKKTLTAYFSVLLEQIWMNWKVLNSHTHPIQY